MNATITHLTIAKHDLLAAQEVLSQVRKMSEVRPETLRYFEGKVGAAIDAVWEAQEDAKCARRHFA